MSFRICFDSIKKARRRATRRRSTKYAPSQASANDACSICLGEFGKKKHVLSCGHAFHFKCVARWLVNTQSCPICRCVPAPAIFAGIQFKKTQPGVCPAISRVLCANSYQRFAPISRIDEGVQEHFTQILFILKEAFSQEGGAFLGWRPFTKEHLVELCRAEEWVYIDNWDDGAAFVNEFPQKITEFLILYCKYDSNKAF